MDLLSFNFSWMAWNLYLALIPVAFGFVMLKNKNLIVKFIAGLIWFFYLPNTIYLITDLVHINHDIPYLNGFYLLLDIALFVALALLGFLTYVVSVYFFEKLISKNKEIKKNNYVVIFILNLLVGFGVVLGRFQVVNSWEMITNIGRVIQKSIDILITPQLLFYALLFAFVCQISYYSFRKLVLKRI